MSKVQGKQVADQTIEQKHLLLSTPSSGDTISGATVGYVNSTITSISGSTVIGPAEDGSYTDGIFTDFTESTRIGVAVDRFNEMFKLLAPTPPSGDWTGAITSMQITDSKVSARQIGDGTTRTSSVIITPTPAYTVIDSVGTGVNARTKDGVFVFTLKNWDGTTIESTTIHSGSTTKSSGNITYTIADPYFGVSGQAGFWTGVTAFNAAGTSASITPSVSGRTLSFEHPTAQTRTTATFYVDNSTHTPSVNSLTISGIPSMTRFVSGVPSLAGGQQFTGINFNIANVSSYFYALTNQVWNIIGTRVSTLNGDLDAIPQTVGATGTVTNVSATITAGYAESISFTVTPYNRSAAAGTTSAATWSTLRIDTVSDESARLVSGSGSYPSTGWGGAWGANSGVSLLVNTNELQMLNGNYIYPSSNYTAFGGPNYVGASGTRWVTFNLGTITAKSNIRITFANPVGITAATQANLLIEVKVSGVTYWVDGDVAYAGVGNPGSTVDGTAACTLFTTSTREITFGSQVLTGTVIIRVGLTGTGVSFSSVSKTDLS